MDQLFNTLASPQFHRSMYSLSVVTFVLALGVVVVAFAFYGRGRENDHANENWVLLFATWRDSLIITLLFLSEGFLYRTSELQGLAEFFPNSIFLYAPAITPIASTIIYVLIFVVASLRIILVSRWLSKHSSSS